MFHHKGSIKIEIAAVIGIAFGLLVGGIIVILNQDQTIESSQLGAPSNSSFTRDLLPEADSAFDLGTTSLQYRQLYVDQVCVGGNACVSSVSGGATAADFAWVIVSDGVSTSTRLVLNDGFISTASSTINSTLRTTGESIFDSLVDADHFVATSSTATSTFAAGIQLSNIGDVVIKLEADTDNVTETDNPAIEFSQDGGAITARIGFKPNLTNTFQILSESKFGDAHFEIGTQNVPWFSILQTGQVGIGTTTNPNIGIAQLAASSTDYIGFLVDQRGTKDIVQFQDSGTTIFSVADGGNTSAKRFFEEKPVTFAGKKITLVSPYDTSLTEYRVVSHIHSNVNAGADTPTALVTFYKNLGYDGAILTDHDAATADPAVSGITTITGDEETTNIKHITAVNVTQDVTSVANGEQATIDAITADGGFAWLNHPNFTSSTYWSDAAIQSISGAQGMEIYNSLIFGSESAETDWDVALTAGKRLYGIAADDCHDITTDNCGVTSLIVFADSSSKSDLLNSLQAGNFYATATSSKSSLNISTDENVITASTDEASTIDFITRGGTISQTSSSATTASYTVLGDEKYVRVKITSDSDAGQAWSNPIYVTSEGVDIETESAIFGFATTSGLYIGNIATSTLTIEADINNNGSAEDSTAGIVFKQDGGAVEARVGYIDDDGVAGNRFEITNVRSFDDDLSLGTANTPRLYIEAAGNIGIGTVVPAALLDINGDVRFSGGSQDYVFTDRSSELSIQSKTAGSGSFLGLYSQDGDGTDDVEFGIWALGTPASITNFERLQYRYENSDNTFYIQSGSGGSGSVRPIELRTGSNTQIVLTADGNVGIGTTSPAFLLDVDGDLRVGEAGNADVFIVDATNGRVGIGTSTPQSVLDIASGASVLGPRIINNDETTGEDGNNLVTVGTEIKSLRFHYSGPTNGAEYTFGKISTINYNTEGTGWYNISGRFDAGLGFSVSSNGTLSEALRITDTGSVGIGTTSPGSLLSVNGIVNFTAATSTFYSTGGLDLTGGGCFAIDGVCVGGGVSDTNLTEEEVEDFAGALVASSSGTHTGLSITYQDATSDVDFVVDNLEDLAGTLDVASGGTGITSFGTGVATWLGTPSSANLATAVTGETGSGALVFGTSPTLSTFFGTACTGQNFLQDISDTGGFTCGAATGSSFGQAFEIDADDNLAATSTTIGVAADHLLATSTVSTSTFSGGLVLDRTTGINILSVIPGGDIGRTSAPVGDGAVIIDNSLNTATPGLYVHSTQAGVPSNPLVILRSTDNAYNQGLLWILGTSGNTGGAAYGIKIEDGNPDIEFEESDQSSPAGRYEIDVNNDLLRFNGRNTADNSYSTFAWFSRFDKGVQGGGGRFCLGCGFGDLETSVFNIVATSTPALPYFTLSTASTSAATGDILTVDSGGNVGIGSTTPGSLLSVNGVTNFTTATSTFYSSGGLDLTGGGCFAIDGVCVGGGGGSSLHVDAGGSVYPADGDFHSAPYYEATSTTATSTFTNAVTIGTTTKTAKLTVSDESGSLGSSYGIIRTISTDDSGGNYDIRIDSPLPDIEIIETDQISPAGKFELGVANDDYYVASRNAQDDGFERIFTIYPYRSGGMVGIGTQFDLPTATLEVVGTTTLDLFNLTSVKGGTRGDYVTVDISGNFGISSSTPSFPLSVGGSSLFSSNITLEGSLRNTGNMDIYPNGQTTRALRISDDGSNIDIQAIGTSFIDINDGINVTPTLGLGLSTSTFNGNVGFATTSFQQGTSNFQGEFLFDVSNSTKNGVTVYSEQDSPDGGASPLTIAATGVNNNRPALRIFNEGTGGGAAEIRIDGPVVDIELIENDQVSPAGKFEIGVANDDYYVASRNTNDDGFERIFTIYPYRSGGMVGIGTQFDFPDAIFEVVGTSSKDILNLTSVKGGTRGDYLTVDLNGQLGIGSTSPEALLAVGGSALIGSNITLEGSLRNTGNLDIYPNGQVTRSLRIVDNGSNIVISGTGATNIDINDDLTLPTTKLTVGGTGVSSFAGNLGIGTTTPTVLLDVDGDFRVGIAGNSEILFVDVTASAVGLGSTTPSFPLSVNGSSLFSSNITLEGSLRNTGNLDIYPGGQVTRALRISDDTTNINFDILGGGELDINDVTNFTAAASSTFTGGIQVNALDVQSTSASSTFANGIDLSGGCFSINGTCIGAGGGTVDGSGATNLVAYWSDANTLTSNSIFTFDGTNFGVSSTTTAFPLSVGGSALFSANITLEGSFRNTGNLDIYPQGQVTRGLRIADDGTQIEISGIGVTEIEILDNLDLPSNLLSVQGTGVSYFSDQLAIGTTTQDSTVELTIGENGAAGTVVGPVLDFRQLATSINGSDDSQLGKINFTGNDKFAGEQGIGAQIQGVASGFWNGTTNDYPTDLIFFTTPNGSGALTERLKIGAEGVITIASGGSLAIPISANPTVGTLGFIAINNTAASSSLRYYDGTAERALYPSTDSSAIYASSTLSFDGAYGSAGTTTLMLANYRRPVTLEALYCKTDQGTAYVEIGTGIASSTVLCNTTGAESTGTVTFNARQNYYISIGTQTSDPNLITVTDSIRQDAD